FDWKRWPETEALVADWIALALRGNRLAAHLAERMDHETNTRFADWVDHLVVSDQPGQGLLRRLTELGFERQPDPYAVGMPVYAHPRAIFPRIVLAADARIGARAAIREVAIKVESIAAFSQAHDLGLTLVGYPLGPYRIARVPAVAEAEVAGSATVFSVVE